MIRLGSMAPTYKFLISAIGSCIGLGIFLTWPTWMGFAGFVAVFVISSVLAAAVFKRTATVEQVKQDLQHRSKFGSG